jgi:hypothetical protein
MVKTLLLSMVLICLSSISYSQKFSTNENQLILEDKASNAFAALGSKAALQNSKTGTFQLIFSERNMQYAVTDDFLKWIEENRLLDKDQTLQIEEDISILILSKEKIEAADFQPVTAVIYSGKP